MLLRAGSFSLHLTFPGIGTLSQVADLAGAYLCF